MTAPAPAAGRGAGAAPPSSFTPSPDDIDDYVGRYRSDEAETELVVALERGELVVKRRPDTVLRMRPAGRDVFTVSSLGTVTFHRAGETVTELGVKLDRVWDLRFSRVP